MTVLLPLFLGFAVGFTACRIITRRELRAEPIAAAWRADILQSALAEVRAAQSLDQAAERIIDLIPSEFR